MRWLTLSQALSGLLLLSACPCDRGQSEVFHEDFESWCEGVPCGWELAAGQVERSTSYHAGEHGAQLSGGARLLVELDGVLLAATEDPDYLIFMIRCDLEAGLRFTLEVEGEGGSYPLVVELPVGAGFGSEIMQMSGLELPAREGEPPPAQPVLRLDLEQWGEGSCFIDELRVLSGNYVRCMG